MTLRDNKGRQKEGEFDSVRAVDVGLNACQAGTKTELCLFSHTVKQAKIKRFSLCPYVDMGEGV